jgi:hypothetical protein
MKTSRERMEDLMNVSLEEACLKNIEANQGKVRIKMEAGLEEMQLETIGSLEDRYLVVKRRRRSEKRTQGNSGSRQKLAADRRRLTPRAVPALCKKSSRRGRFKTAGNGIRGRSRSKELRLGNKKTLYEALEQTLDSEVVKRAVGISIGLRKMSDWTSWRSRPPPKRKKRRQKHSPRKKEMAVRL